MVSFTASGKALLLAILAIAPSALAQTYTDCNPLNETCPANQALGVSNYTIDFTTSTPSSKVWNTTSGTIDYTEKGAEFTINEKGDSPTIQSEFYIFFGKLEVIMKAANGTGIVSSIVLQSDDLDEVDWEFLGGNHTTVQTNYFGKGDTSSYDRAIYYSVEDPMDGYHNYTVDWTSDRLNWMVDGEILRTLNYSSAENGTRYPQTPMNVRLGIWVGGDSDLNSEGTVEWAGGETDYDDAPFTMYVQSVRVSDSHTNVTSYQYSDHSGSWKSIKLLQEDDANATSSISSDLDGNNSQSTSEKAKSKWNSLSKTAKVAIGSSAAGVAVLGVIAFAFCCIKQRKAGRRERALADAEYEKQTAELLQYRSELNRQRSERLTNIGNNPVVGSPASGSGVGGRMKRLSQQLGLGGGSGNGRGVGGAYQGEYHRF
ncbi:putative cell wall glucanase [Phaeomoniella chlamydospora]|uniref:chitinase n=1 Tax=Phaeomoniella chlamydospora TaxID=158046 RepID=A0A0G2DXS9_PHACM|nr:putative cell wall glucanase [Phaeomoniella chlamydospora]